MDKTAQMKAPLMCYFHFMFNEWNESKAKKVFANASCGWQYLWQKWCSYCDRYGLYAAITMYYTDGLDRNLQKMLADAANEHYSGK